MENIIDSLERQIYSIKNSINFYDTHIRYLKIMQKRKPELERVFEASYNDLILNDINSNIKYKRELEILQNKLLLAKINN